MDGNYTYPAILKAEADTIDITFPAFDGATTCAGADEDVIATAQEFLALMLIDRIDANEPVPEAAPVAQGEGARVVYVNVWLPYFRSRTRETYTKKTLTIPTWLDLLAKNNDINFSATLVEALKRKLGVED